MNKPDRNTEREKKRSWKGGEEREGGKRERERGQREGWRGGERKVGGGVADYKSITRDSHNNSV